MMLRAESCGKYPPSSFSDNEVLKNWMMNLKFLERDWYEKWYLVKISMIMLKT